MARSDIFEVPDDIAPILATDADGRLYYGNRHSGFTRFDRSYIGAAASAFAAGRDIALVYPSPPTHVQVPILLAVGFQTLGRSPPALFVSNRPGIREQYFSLGIGPVIHPGGGINPVPLSHFTAPMAKTGDGSRLSYITGHKPNHWDSDDPSCVSLVHTTFGKKIANTLSDDLPLSGFVLDFTNRLLDDRSTQETYRFLAEERAIPRIMVFDSPNHKYLDRLESQNEDRDDDKSVVFWGWSPSSLENAHAELLEPVADIGPSRDGAIANDGGSIPSPFTDTQASLENLRNGITRSIVRVPYGDLEPVAKETYRRIGETARFPRGLDDDYSAESSDVLSGAYFLYMYLDTLPISVEFHDSLSALDDTYSWGASNTLQGKVDRLRSRSHTLERDVPGSSPMLEDACDALEEMVDLLVVHNPKSDAIAEEIRDVQNENKQITILTATRKQESLLRSFVAEKTEFSEGATLSDDVAFHSLYNPHTIPDADVLLFPGVPTRSHYPAVQSGAAPEHRYLTYPWEIDRLERRLADVSEVAEWRVGPAVQRHAADELNLGTEGLGKYVKLEDARRPGPRQRHRSGRGSEMDHKRPAVDESREKTSDARSIPVSDRIGASQPASPDDISIDLGGLAPKDDADAFWDEEVIYDDGAERETIDEGRSNVSDRIGSDSDGRVQALRVDFVDGDYMFEEPRGLVWVLEDIQDGSNVARTRRAAASLERGDRVLMIEDDSRRDVFKHVVEKIHSECRGEFQMYLSMLDLWTTGIDHVVDFWREIEDAHNADPRTFDADLSLRKIAELVADDLDQYAVENDEPDAKRGKQAIYNWLTKDTLGPGSPEAIRALGDVYDIEVLECHSKEIFAGLKEIRALHVRIGNKLGKIVFSAHDADADEWLLEECGLRVSDVQDATVVKTVEAVSTETIEVEARRVGKLNEAE